MNVTRILARRWACLAETVTLNAIQILARMRACLAEALT